MIYSSAKGYVTIDLTLQGRRLDQNGRIVHKREFRAPILKNTYAADAKPELDCSRPVLDVVLTVYNEAEAIRGVVSDFYEEIVTKLPCKLIVAEDGSIDGTREILTEMTNEMPISLLSDPRRKGFAGGVRNAITKCEEEWILFSDSDGQYLPSDFWQLWENRDGYDMIVGRKLYRREGIHRTILAKGFHGVANILFGLNLHDSDCGFRLVRKDLVDSIVDEVKVLKYSFWAELTIRSCLKGFKVLEVPINHSIRINGTTRIYSPMKIPYIISQTIERLIRAVRGNSKRLMVLHRPIDPVVSVIVPVYNGSRTVLRTLVSIVKQDPALFELIVVDDGSSDSTSSLVEKFFRESEFSGKFSLVKHLKNLGLSMTLNDGLQRAQGSYVLILHQDCEFVGSDWISRALSNMKNESVAVVTGYYGIPDVQDESFVKRAFGVLRKQFHSCPGCSCEEVTFSEGKCDLYRLSYLLKAGGFPTRYRIAGEDLIVSYTLRNMGYLILKCYDLQVVQRFTGDAETFAGNLKKEFLFGKVLGGVFSQFRLFLFRGVKNSEYSGSRSIHRATQPVFVGFFILSLFSIFVFLVFWIGCCRIVFCSLAVLHR